MNLAVVVVGTHLRNFGDPTIHNLTQGLSRLQVITPFLSLETEKKSSIGTSNDMFLYLSHYCYSAGGRCCFSEDGADLNGMRPYVILWKMSQESLGLDG